MNKALEPPNIRLNLLVLRCRHIDATRRFYEALGLQFKQEQHGSSPLSESKDQQP